MSRLPIPESTELWPNPHAQAHAPGLDVVYLEPRSDLDRYLDEVEARHAQYLSEETEQRPSPMPWTDFGFGLVWITLSVIYLIGIWRWIEPVSHVLGPILTTGVVMIPTTLAFGIGWWYWHQD